MFDIESHCLSSRRGVATLEPNWLSWQGHSKRRLWTIKGKGKITSPLDLPLPAEGEAETKQERTYRGIREAILNGLPQAEDRLPSTRLLAQRWGIARGTLETVFETATA